MEPSQQDIPGNPAVEAGQPKKSTIPFLKTIEVLEAVPGPEASFSEFGQLPKEVRQMIWQCAVPRRIYGSKILQCRLFDQVLPAPHHVGMLPDIAFTCKDAMAALTLEMFRRTPAEFAQKSDLRPKWLYPGDILLRDGQQRQSSVIVSAKPDPLTIGITVTSDAVGSYKVLRKEYDIFGPSVNYVVLPIYSVLGIIDVCAMLKRTNQDLTGDPWTVEPSDPSTLGWDAYHTLRAIAAQFRSAATDEDFEKFFVTYFEQHFTRQLRRMREAWDRDNEEHGRDTPMPPLTPIISGLLREKDPEPKPKPGTGHIDRPLLLGLGASAWRRLLPVLLVTTCLISPALCAVWAAPVRSYSFGNPPNGLLLA